MTGSTLGLYCNPGWIGRQIAALIRREGRRHA